jgi:hypothetical protein
MCGIVVYVESGTSMQHDKVSSSLSEDIVTTIVARSDQIGISI